MKTPLQKLQSEAHEQLLDIRNLEHFVNTTKFEDAWEQAGSGEREFIIHLTETVDMILLKKLIDEILKKDISTKLVTDLRQIASSLGMVNCNQYPKSVLLAFIKSKEKPNA